MTRRKELAIVTPVPPWSRDGVSRIVTEVTRRLLGHFDISLFCVAATGENTHDASHYGVSVKVFNAMPHSFGLSLALSRALAHSHVDLVHAHCHGTFEPVLAAMGKGGNRLVVSPYFHIGGATAINSLLRRVWDPVAGRIQFYRADGLVCLSNLERDIVLERFPRIRKCWVIPCGVNLSEIRAAPTLADFSGKKVILYVGRLTRFKNVHLVMYALQHLPPEYLFVIIGAGPFEDTLRDTARRLGLENRVIMLGVLEDTELWSWYRTARVVALLSEREAFGIPCLEALAAGTPVVVNTRAAGLRELGNKFDPFVLQWHPSRNSSEDIAALLSRAAAMGRIDLDLSNYDWDIVAADYEAIYSTLS